mgnify:CR=1 FL=1
MPIIQRNNVLRSALKKIREKYNIYVLAVPGGAGEQAEITDNMFQRINTAVKNKQL